MWLRTTLVFREGTAWEVDEFCEPIADLRHKLEEEFYFPETVVEVITLAHKYAVPDSDLGFYMYDRAVLAEQEPVEDVATQLADKTLFPPRTKKKLKATSSRLRLSSLRVRLFASTALCIRVLYSV